MNKIGTNAEFLSAIFGENHQTLWVCSFPQPPGPSARWKGCVFEEKTIFPLGQNNYFSVAELAAPNRTLKAFVRMGVLVLDDFNTEQLDVLPSYRLETSPGNYQVGFILNDSPEARDSDLCSKILKVLSQHELIKADKSGNNAVRYVRLPFGTNNKPRDTGPFQHVLSTWEPSRRFDLLELFKLLCPEASLFYTPSENFEDWVLPARFDDKRAIEEILSGETFHQNIVRLSAKYAQQGMAERDICSLLYTIMDRSEAKSSNSKRWADRRASIPAAVSSAVRKFSPESIGFSNVLDKNPEPLNFFPDTTRAKPTFDRDDFPLVVSNLSCDIAKRMGCDPSVPAFTMIAAANGLSDDRIILQVKSRDTGWCESSRLWIAFIGEPSTKKSPGMNAVLGPIRKMQARWHIEYEEKLRDWKVKELASKKTGYPAPPQPSPKKAFVNDTTLEALAGNLINNPRGILSVQDELSGWFGNMDAYRGKSGPSKDRAAFLTAYNGGELFIDRVGQGPKFVRNFSVSIIGGIQPGPIRKLANKSPDEDGLLQRFIPLVISPASHGEDTPPDLSSAQAWEEVCEELSEMEGPITVVLATDAQPALDAARLRLARFALNPQYDGRLRSALQKAEGQLARLVLTFHLIENRDDAELLGEILPSQIVTKSTVDKAWRLFYRFILPNMFTFYEEILGGTEDMKLTRAVAGYLLSHEAKKVAARDIYRAHGEFRSDDGRVMLARIMGHLEMGGWVLPDNGKPGKMPSSWKINPRIYSEFREMAAAERERRDRVKLEIAEAASLSKMSLEEEKEEELM